MNIYDFDIEWVGLDVLVEVLQWLSQALFELLDRGMILNTQFKIDAHFSDFFFGVIDDLWHIHLVIGYIDDVVIVIEQWYFGEINIGDLSLVATYFDIVINIDFFRKTDDNAADDTTDIVFGDDGQGSTHYTQWCQQTLKIQAPKSKNHQNDAKGHNKIIHIIDTVDDVICKFVRDVFPQPVHHDQGSSHDIDDGQQYKKLHDGVEEVKSIMKVRLIDFYPIF